MFVYDSMYLSIGSHTRNQIAALMACKEDDIILQMMNVQVQTGGYDCCLFAIAFATAIANGVPLRDVSFKQDTMRKHLYQCFDKGILTVFPTVPRRKRPRGTAAAIKSTDTIPLYCHCRMPEIQPMVECSRCKEWYHADCVDMPTEALNNSLLIFLYSCV